MNFLKKLYKTNEYYLKMIIILGSIYLLFVLSDRFFHYKNSYNIYNACFLVYLLAFYCIYKVLTSIKEGIISYRLIKFDKNKSPYGFWLVAIFFLFLGIFFMYYASIPLLHGIGNLLTGK